MSAKSFFSYSSSMGLEFWATEAEARDSAENEIEQYREDAKHDGEWPVDTDSVLWGRVVQRATEKPCEIDGADFVDFVLVDVPGAATGGAS